MPLAAGSRLGPYEILAPLGSGGMGEVYRARDGKLNRDVALKILPDTFATDHDRLARFRREAQVLASLNHPNIGHIYGFEDAHSTHSAGLGQAGSGQGGVTYALVLELVEGPTLADRIAQGPIPVAEALPIARQIADALEVAHEQGIIHRDLKPANVKLKVAWGPTPTRHEDGRREPTLATADVTDCIVKVLDFGLAKAFDPIGASAAEAGNLPTSPTLTARATQMGVILGTAAYMSPEQAKGKSVDRRADIWAFGAVLYEMLSGRRAFLGDDISDTLAAVLRQEVEWRALPASTPPAVTRLIARCLERDVRRRLRDIGEARILLEDPMASEARSDASAQSAIMLAPIQPLWRRAIPLALGAFTIAALAGAAAWYLKPPTPPPPLAVSRFAVNLPEGQAFTGTGRHTIAISADGAQMAYVANNRLYLKAMSELEAKPLQGTELFRNVTEPVFSPDGRSIAFHAGSDQTLKRIATAGGPAVTICPAGGLYGMSWTSDGISFGQGPNGIMRVSPNGGNPSVLVTVKDPELAHGPQVLPDGQHVLFTLTAGIGENRWGTAQIVVQSLTSGERKTLIEVGSDARYLPTGHIVYAHSGTLFAVPFDARRLEVQGGPVPIVEGVRRASGGSTGAAYYGVSASGSLIYVPGPASTSELSELVLADRKGAVEPLKLPAGAYVYPRVSPDGKRVAFGTDDGKEASVWVYDLSGANAMQRVTFGGKNRFPIWASDNKHVVFQSDRDGDLGIFWQPADGTGAVERLTKSAQGEVHIPESWSPKGDTLMFNVTKGSDVALWTFSMQDRKTAPFGGVRSIVPTNAVFSPDGRWVAYVVSAPASTIYVQPFPPTGAKYQMFEGSGWPHEMVWSPDGKELFYNPRPGAFEVVSVKTAPSVAFGNPVAVPRSFRLAPPAARRGYDITPGGKFLGLTDPGLGDLSGTAGQIRIVLNWLEELKQRTAAR